MRVANRIKGITVEIGGDTLKLQQSLQQVNSNIRQTQSELKDVERLLKLDPHNTELLAQKQKLLSTSIEETTKKLEALKQAEEQSKKALQNGEITEEQFRGLQREIIATKEELDKLNEQLKNTDSGFQATTKKVGEKVSAVGEKITSVGTTLSKNVTAPIIAVGAAATLAFNEIDEGYDTIVKKTGATGDAFVGLKEVADNIFKSLPVNMSDVGVAVGEVNTRFHVTGEELQELSTLFIKFAEINETDLNNAIGLTNKIMVQWGIDTKETANVLGLITQKAQDTGISVDTLMNGVQQYGSVMKEMGLSLGQGINLLAQFEANGVNADQALMGLKKAVAAYVKDGLSMDEALKKTIDSIKNASSETEALSIATSIFGAKGATEMTKAIREGRISFDELSGSMSEYGEVVNNTFEGTEDGIDQFQVAMNNAKLALGSLGESISDVLGPILQQVAVIIGNLATWFDHLDPSIKQAIVVIGLVVAAVGPLLVVLGTIISSIGSIITAIGTLSGVFSAIGGVIGTVVGAISAPVLAIVAAVAAVIAIGVALIKNWDEVKAFCITAWQAIQNTFSTICQSIQTTVTSIWENIKTYISNTLTTIQEIFSNIWNQIKETISSVWTGIRQGIEAVLNAIQTIINSVWNTVAQITSTVWQTIKETVHTIFTSIHDVVVSILTTIQEFIQKSWQTIQQMISNVLETIRNTMQSVWNNIYSTISNLVNSILSTVSSVFDSMYSAISGTIDNIYSTVSSGFDNAVSYISGLISSAYSWGSDLISGIVAGITSKISAVINAVSNVASTIWSYLHFSVPEVGPLTDYQKWMPDFVKGLSDSLEKSKGVIKKSVSKLSNELVINPNIPEMKTSSDAKGFRNQYQDLIRIVNDMTNSKNNKEEIVIPIYLGGNLLDEFILDAQHRQLIKSGGR